MSLYADSWANCSRHSKSNPKPNGSESLDIGQASTCFLIIWYPFDSMPGFGKLMKLVIVEAPRVQAARLPWRRISLRLTVRRHFKQGVLLQHKKLLKMINSVEDLSRINERKADNFLIARKETFRWFARVTWCTSNRVALLRPQLPAIFLRCLPDQQIWGHHDSV